MSCLLICDSPALGRGRQVEDRKPAPPFRVLEERDGSDVLQKLRELQVVIEQLQEQFTAPVAAILGAMRHDREG